MLTPLQAKSVQSTDFTISSGADTYRRSLNFGQCSAVFDTPSEAESRS